MPWIKKDARVKGCVLPNKEESEEVDSSGIWKCPVCRKRWYVERHPWTETLVYTPDPYWGGCGD